MWTKAVLTAGAAERTIDPVNGQRLARSVTDRRLGGVCGGLAEYFNLDPLLVRVAFVVAALMGWGVLAYVVLWIVLPKREPGPTGAVGSAGALRIAEERFARGEISADELATIRRDLARQE